MTRIAADTAAEDRFERVLTALDRELVEATDQEIVEAAHDLGMNLAMKGSAAFIGLKSPSRGDIMAFFESFFGPDADYGAWFGKYPTSPKLESPGRDGRLDGSASDPSSHELDRDDD